MKPTSLALIVAAISAVALIADAAPLAPKALVITMFKNEATNWLQNQKLEHKIAIPGLSTAFPDLSCNDAGLCLVTTSMGYANAASSILALDDRCISEAGVEATSQLGCWRISAFRGIGARQDVRPVLGLIGRTGDV